MATVGVKGLKVKVFPDCYRTVLVSVRASKQWICAWMVWTAQPHVMFPTSSANKPAAW